MSDVREATYWDARYQGQDTPWNLGCPAPALESWLAKEPRHAGRVAVFGSGPGHDAIALAKAGYCVTGFDFAPGAIAEASANAKAAGVAVDFDQVDIFALPHVYDGAFDLLVEHTCFCAIPVERRDEYVEAAYRALKPGGELIAIFFTHADPGGPPFATTESEVRERFARRFEVLELVPVGNSVTDRQGEETFARLRRR